MHYCSTTLKSSAFIFYEFFCAYWFRIWTQEIQTNDTSTHNTLKWNTYFHGKIFDGQGAVHNNESTIETTKHGGTCKKLKEINLAKMFHEQDINEHIALTFWLINTDFRKGKPQVEILKGKMSQLFCSQ